MAGQYLHGADPCTPLASPLYADLSGLPPLLIVVGGDEALLDDSVRLARSAGRRVLTSRSTSGGACSMSFRSTAVRCLKPTQRS
jgi:hypothetical protein